METESLMTKMYTALLDGWQIYKCRVWKQEFAESSSI